MSQSESLKILITGDVEGRLNDLYSKVKTIQTKAGKFDLLICVGEFFAEKEEDNAEIEKYCSEPSSIPIQTYVIGTNRSKRLEYFRDPSGYDICKDKIIYLGPKGIFSARNGLSIAYLSGIEERQDSSNKRVRRTIDDSASGQEDEFVRFGLKDVESLISNWDKRNVGECLDILITNQWPKYVEKLSNQQLDNNINSEKFGSEAISYLALKLKPRYHFSAMQNTFFERIPYRNHQVLMEKEVHVSRFLALAKVNPKNKPKVFFQNYSSISKKMNFRDLIQTTTSQISENPYKSNLTIVSESDINKGDENNSSVQFFYDSDHINKMTEQNERKMLEQKRKQEAAQKRELEPCWFCLGGSKVERHYIVSVGNKSYLAYAKGALNNDHLLIIPIDHVQSTLHADSDLLEDINKYKAALIDYFKTKRKCVVFFERNFRTKHMQIQSMAIKEDKSYLLKDSFMAMGRDEGVSLNQIPDMTNLKQVLKPNQSFYYLELPSEEAESILSHTRYLCEIRGNHFPLNFGRDVMASELLLNMPDRVDWKDCVKELDEEKKMSVDFRNEFKKFDPFL